MQSFFLDIALDHLQIRDAINCISRRMFRRAAGWPMAWENEPLKRRDNFPCALQTRIQKEQMDKINAHLGPK